MWSATRPTRTPVEECAHEVRIITTSVGLEREACEECGHVNFRYVSRILESQIEQIEAFDHA